MKRLIPFLMAIMTASVVQAETRYISDTLYVPLRAGPGNEYRILHRGLKTGTALEILEEASADNGEEYAKVRTRTGNEGYIPVQYLLKEEPAKDQLERIQKENGKLVSQDTEYRKQLGAFETSNRELTDKLNSSTQKVRKLEQELTRIREVSANSLEIDNRNKTLVVNNEQLKAQLNTLQVENQQLSDSTHQRWYLYGALTLLIGVLLGLFGPLLKPKKKSSWI
ncbi:TIGR04211 family SH3 domain-containing protein [Kistimonas asteriae]|uniref:TIGR04211 family SH3 domain-containing protein n=1 Tax=Kistimonas asteriae TaxID=517724 RepID=UPI001BA9787F|nr:TIGR04211 family SH3 domain-containing protein [Kistimonas asteriae]